MERHREPHTVPPLTRRPHLDLPRLRRLRRTDHTPQPRIRLLRHRNRRERRRLTVYRRSRSVVLRTLGELPDDLPAVLPACDRGRQRVGGPAVLPRGHLLAGWGVLQQVNEEITESGGAHGMVLSVVARSV